MYRSKLEIIALLINRYFEDSLRASRLDQVRPEYVYSMSTDQKHFAPSTRPPSPGVLESDPSLRTPLPHKTARPQYAYIKGLVQEALHIIGDRIALDNPIIETHEEPEPESKGIFSRLGRGLGILSP
jgi:hypothetical protein